MGNQNPRNSPPALPLGDQGSIGYKYGLQSSEVWLPGESDNRPICDQLLAAHMWRVSVFCSRYIAINIVFGSSRAQEFRDLRGPLVFYAPGQVTVYAQPYLVELNQGGYAHVTATAVNSAQASQARRVWGTPGPLPDYAARFYALAASHVSIDGTSVALAIGQTLPLVAGAALIDGLGYLEFES
jgi:hypothetical protein